MQTYTQNHDFASSSFSVKDDCEVHFLISFKAILWLPVLSIIYIIAVKKKSILFSVGKHFITALFRFVCQWRVSATSEIPNRNKVYLKFPLSNDQHSQINRK